MADTIPMGNAGVELMDRARSLVPVLRERAIQTETLRQVPVETIDDMRRLGLFKAAQPRRYGGYEIELDQVMALISEIGRGCGSSAWVFGIFCDHAITLGMFPEQAQEDVWGSDPDALASSGLAPSGTVTRVPGGFRLDGQWSFSSGCDHAGWVFVQGVTPPGEDNDKPAHAYFLLPKSDYRILDTWHVIGLCGTGSKDIVIDNAFVPVHRRALVADINESRAPGTAINPGPLYRLPRAGTVPFTLGSPAIGVVQSMYDEFIDMMRVRSSRGFQLAEQATIQVRVAEAAAEIDCAKLLLARDCQESMASIRSHGQLTMAQRARNRRDMAYMVKLCAQAAERIFAATGGAGLYTNTNMQRMYRDVIAISHHYINSWDISATTFGRIALGLPPIHPAI